MLTTEEILEYMTIEQMMMTRIRQINHELEKTNLGEQVVRDLLDERWVLVGYLNGPGGINEVKSLKTAIINNEPPEVE